MRKQQHGKIQGKSGVERERELKLTHHISASQTHSGFLIMFSPKEFWDRQLCLCCFCFTFQWLLTPSTMMFFLGQLVG